MNAKWLWVLSMLLWGGVLFAADTTYYVSSTGSDLNDGSAIDDAHAFATITKAMDGHASDTSGDTVTIKIKDGDTLAGDNHLDFDSDVVHTPYAFVIEPVTAGQTYTVQPLVGADTGWIRINAEPCSVTIRGMCMSETDAGTCNYTVRYISGDGTDLILEDCDLVSDTGQTWGWGLTYSGVATTGSITLTRTRLAAKHGAIKLEGATDIVVQEDSILESLTATTGVIYVAYSAAVDIDTFTIDDSNLIGGASGTGLYFYDNAQIDIDEFSLTDSTITVGSTGLIAEYVAGNTIGHAVIRDNTWTLSNADATNGILMYAGFRDLEFRNNTMTFPATGAVTTGGFGTLDYAAAGRIKTDTGINSLIIANNSFTGGSAATTCHGLSFWISGAEVYGNTIETKTHGLVVGGNYCRVHHNIVKTVAGSSLCEWGDYNSIYNNTVVALAGNAYLSGVTSGTGTDADVWPYSRHSAVFNNIFYAAASYAFWDYEGEAGADDHGRGDLGGDEMSHYMDYNCYYNATTADTVKLGTTPVSCTTIAELVAAWSTADNGGVWNTMYAGINDVHSVIINPRFKDISGGDYRVHYSKLLYSGLPDASGNPGYIGAIGPVRR